jgi:pimeloyl-ACP methyl ester carboxylesterase
MIVQGMHFHGPADPRFDRFSRILAAAGLLVAAPFLPDYVALLAREGVIHDAARAFGALRRLEALPPDILPGIFSISFGSLPALRVASMPEHAASVGGIVAFGGYADWAETAEFCMTGEIAGERHAPFDPLDQPVVFMNLIEDIDGAPADPSRLLDAWREYVRATWGRPAMKTPAGYEPVARRITETLPEDLRHLFLQGCRVEDGGLDLARQALADGAERLKVLDARPFLSGLRCPVYLVHGIDDDVVPYTQMDALRAAMPPQVKVETHLTGLYGHTAKVGILDLFRRIPAAAGELHTMLCMMRAIVAAATARP